MWPIFMKVMLQIGAANQFGFIQYILRFDPFGFKVFFGITALIFQQTFMRDCVKCHSATGGYSQHRLGIFIGQITPANGV